MKEQMFEIIIDTGKDGVKKLLRTSINEAKLREEHELMGEIIRIKKIETPLEMSRKTLDLQLRKTYFKPEYREMIYDIVNRYYPGMVD